MESLKNILHEILGFIYLVFGFYLFAILYTYCPFDYPGDIMPSHTIYHNIGGYWGTYLSRWLFLNMGVCSSYLAALFFICWGGWIFLAQGPSLPSFEMGGLVLLVATVEAEANGLGGPSTIPGGGYYGIYFAAFLKSVFPFSVRYLLYLSLAALFSYLLLQEGLDWWYIQDEQVEKSNNILIDEGDDHFLTPPSLKTLIHTPLQPFSLPLGFYKASPNRVFLQEWESGKSFLIGGENSKTLLEFLENLLISLRLKYKDLKMVLLQGQKNNEVHSHYLTQIPGISIIRNKNAQEHLIDTLDSMVENKKKNEKLLFVIGDLGEMANEIGFLINRMIPKIQTYIQEDFLYPIFYTSRPSYDVIPSEIQEIASFRLALPVSTKIESSILLGCEGAEKLEEREGLVVDPRWNHPIPILLPQCSYHEKKSLFSSSFLWENYPSNSQKKAS